MGRHTKCCSSDQILLSSLGMIYASHTRASTDPLVVPYVPRYPDILNLLGVDIQQAGPYIIYCVYK